MSDKPVRAKAHLEDVFRTPLDRLDRQDFLRLDKNEDPLGLPREFLEKVFSGVSPSFISSYPQPDQIYDKLSQWLGLGQDHLLVTSGSDAAIKNAFEVFVSPGDGVVFPEPTYAMFNVYEALFQADVTHIGYEKDLSFSVAKMRDAIGPKTKLVALANPNSPTGTIIAREDLISLIERAGKSGAVVLVDEAYYPFHNETVIDLVDLHKNLIVTRTFSKAFRLASVRLGFAAAHPDTIDLMKRLRPMYEVNSFAVLFGCAILDNIDLVHHFVDSVAKGKKYIEKETRAMGLSTYPTHANFILIEVGEENVKGLMEFMKESGILISGGFSHPALRKCIRISLGPVDKMRIALDQIKKYFEEARI